ncbi:MULTISPECIES: WxcM-like domain-containing protein [Flavobacterium]|uniref:WxcM-like domain-containing protein n=1 Tax=Flavobacterium keumense TaxID=1306518 RepID=A0ABY8N2U4_9FLAO|nr:MULTISPECIES: WxcM-like domain-containing protein [Flavobacterium]WGK93584.1 WxcM-like domain-containing protein [Flavobacterium keumense]
MKPTLISGNCHQDQRGQLFYNNDFDASSIKRMYVIENHSVDFVRAWQGHKIEQRWFSAVQGRFKIQLIAVDNWDIPSENLPRIEYHLHSEKLDILHIPAGYISSIQALEEKSKLVVMSDYHLGEIDDESRYPTDYFTTE